MRWLQAFAAITGLVFITSVAYGQQTISGKVVDSGSGQPLSFVNIVVAGDEQRGTITGLEGRFDLTIRPGDDQLRLSRVGYQTKVVPIGALKEKPAIAMTEQQLGLSAVVIKPEANPAIPVIRKAVERRKQNDPWRSKGFTLESYNKYALTVDTQIVDSLAEANREKATAGASADTISISKTNKTDQTEEADTSRPALMDQHMLLIESLTRRIYRPPNINKEIVEAQQVSGLDNPDFPIPSVDIEDMNFYERFLEVLGEEYRSPISPGALNKYQYFLADTITKNGETLYLIRYSPEKGRAYRGLKGFLGIHAESYSLGLIRGQPARKSLFNARFKQLHKPEDGLWYPEQVYLSYKHRTYGTKWEINNYIQSIKTGQVPETVPRKDLNVSLADSALLKDSGYWQKHRHIPLTDRDQQTYEVMDSIGNQFKLDEILTIGNKLLADRFPLGPVDLWVSKLFDQDRYQGTRLGAGLLTSDQLSEYVSVGGYFGYGFQDQKTKYGGRLSFYPGGERTYALQFDYQHDVEEIGNFPVIETYTTSELLGVRAFLAKQLSLIDRYQVSFTTSRIRYLRLKAFGRVSDERLLGDFAYPLTKGEGPQFRAAAKRFVETGLKLRFAYGEEAFPLFDKKLTSELPYPVLHVNYIKGWNQGLLGGDFGYNRLKASLSHDFNIPGLGKADLTLESGTVFGNAPVSRLSYGTGNYATDFRTFSPQAFQTMRPYEFVHSEYINLFYQHRLVRIDPGFEQSRPTLYLRHASGFGTLDERYSVSDVAYRTMESGYHESGISVQNMLRFSYLDNAFYFGIGAGAMYRYGPYQLPNLSDNVAFMVNVQVDV